MKLLTNFPVATESPDHICPIGTANDNTTDQRFIEEIEEFFNNKKIFYLDIGCAGGQLVIDFKNRGHSSIGIEGSDYGVKNKKFNWPTYHNELLFTCDATKEYKIVDNFDTLVKFDLITAWEVLEHIHEKDFDSFFANILNHMHVESIFCASINPYEDKRGDILIHQSVFEKEVWYDKLSSYFNVEELPFQSKVRYGGSFHVLCKKK